MYASAIMINDPKTTRCTVQDETVQKEGLLIANLPIGPVAIVLHRILKKCLQCP